MNTMLRTKALILVLSLASAVAAAAPPPAPPATQPAARVARALVSEVLDRAAGAFMFIGGGSGVAIDPDGYVITNAHVVQGSKRWRMRSGAGKAYTADVVGRATMTDLALLKIRGEDLPPHLPLGDSDALHPGEPVVAVGNPFGLGNVDGVPAVSLGSVSALGVDRPRAWDCVVTDAAINPGNSGGPLINADGEVIGVNTMIFSTSGGNVGLGFALPINRVRRVAAEIIRYGRRRNPWPGFKVEDITALRRDLRDQLGLRVEEGGIVVNILTSAPAYNAGLLPGDAILKINGEAIRSSSDVDFAVWDLFVDDPVELEVDRQGTRHTVKFTIQELAE